MSNHPSEQPQIIVHGNYIAEQNIQTQNNFYGKETHLSADHSTSNTQVNTLATEGHKSVADELMPFFWNKSDKVEEFLASATGADPISVCSQVNKLAAKGIIDPSVQKVRLWDVLHQAGIYPGSKSTFSRRVDFRP